VGGGHTGGPRAKTRAALLVPVAAVAAGAVVGSTLAPICPHTLRFNWLLILAVNAAFLAGLAAASVYMWEAALTVYSLVLVLASATAVKAALCGSPAPLAVAILEASAYTVPLLTRPRGWRGVAAYMAAILALAVAALIEARILMPE